MQIKKVLVPIDFSENSNQILQEGIWIAQKFDARVEVVFVAQTIQDYSDFFEPHMPIIQFEEDLVASAREKMKAFVEENVEPGYRCETRVLAGDVAEVILEHAADENFDLIVMGTHGYKGLEKILFGSVAEKVVKMAPCPVLTINPYR